MKMIQKTRIQIQTGQVYRTPQEYLAAYTALARDQARVWRMQSNELAEGILEVQRAHLDLILKAPTILKTPEQRAEEDYLRRNMIDAREEMLRIKLSERYNETRRI